MMTYGISCFYVNRSQYRETFGGDGVLNMSIEDKEMTRKRSQEIKKVSEKALGDGEVMAKGHVC